MMSGWSFGEKTRSCLGPPDLPSWHRGDWDPPNLPAGARSELDSRRTRWCGLRIHAAESDEVSMAVVLGTRALRPSPGDTSTRRGLALSPAAPPGDRSARALTGGAVPGSCAVRSDRCAADRRPPLLPMVRGRIIGGGQRAE